jgi:Flp pilus assembly pilin Flp
MSTLTYVRAWLSWKLRRDEAGQDATEYVVMIAAVALFLVLAAIALRPILATTVTAIGTWIAANGPP